MAKVVLNSVRLLSMEELCSVALSKRAVVLEPELAKSLGISPTTSTSKYASCTLGGEQVLRSSNYCDSLINRMICCALLQKALRWKPNPQCTLIPKLVDALNANIINVSQALDSMRVSGKDSNDVNGAITPRVVHTLASVAQVSATGSGEVSIQEVASSLGLSVDEFSSLSHGQTELFATASVLGLVLSAFSKFSDCVFGLVCESLRLPIQCFSSAELQKLPHCVGVARNLLWLTEDSKLIPSSSHSSSSDTGIPGLNMVVSGYVLANGELGYLSKSVLKITSEMLSGICTCARSSDSQSFMEHAWSSSLQSHIFSLHRCLTSVAKCYVSLLPALIAAFQKLLSTATDAGSLEQPLGTINANASEYEKLLKDFESALSTFEDQPAGIDNMNALSVLCGDLSVACASLCTGILTMHESMRKPSEGKKVPSDSTGRKVLLGHGNMGVSNFLCELLDDSGVCGMVTYDRLRQSLAVPRLLQHASRLDILLVPRNNQVRKLKVPKGTVDILPDEMVIRTIVLDAVRSVFKQHGACEIDTPVFELRETLMGKYGEEQKLIFDLKDCGGEQLCLRYDLTVPFARFLGSNKIEKMKRFHIGKVYRRDEPQIQRGRFREFVQCDLDYAGVYPPMVADSEVLFILIRVLRLLCPGKFQVKIGHRVILDSIMSHCGVPTEMHRTICSSIDKLDKEPWCNVREEMVSDKGLSVSVVDALQEFVEVKGSISSVVEFLRGKSLGGASEALEEMLLLDEYLSAFGATSDELLFDLSLARGLDYYTGVIFEAVLTGSSVGSVGAGGRYDGLIGMLSGRQVPSVGMSLGIERLMKVVSHGSVSSDMTDVFVCTVGDASMLPERLRLCSLLWDAGIAAEFHYNPRANLRKQLDAATAKRAQLAVVLGMTELSSGTVRLKVLNYADDSVTTSATGDDSQAKIEEIAIARTEMVHTIRRMLEERALFAKLAIPGNAFLCFFGSGKGSGKISLFFHSIPYIFRKTGCVVWIRKATNDDIINNKYIYIDLFSRSHHNAIETKKEEDDNINGRTNVITYTVNTSKLPSEFSNATFGDVYYYQQLLQADGGYDKRTLVTYNDELQRYCVFIESFDTSGKRVSMRLYRVKRKVWWLKSVASEGNAFTDTWNSFLSTIGFVDQKPIERQTLNITESNCPMGMINYKSSSYDLIYTTAAGGGTAFIGDVIFRSMPMEVSPNCTDLYVWRYFKGEHANITHVVIAELFKTHSSVTYFKCVSTKNSQYEEIDSFGSENQLTSLPDMIDTFPKYTSVYLPLVYRFGPSVEHPYQSGLYVMAYPHANHYIIRPMSDKVLQVITSLKVEGKHNNLNLVVGNAVGYTYVASTHLDKDLAREMSLTSVSNAKVAIAGGRISLTGPVNGHTSLVDQHTLALLKSGLPLQHLNMQPSESLDIKGSVTFDIFNYNDAKILDAQLAVGITFYTPNLIGATGFKNCVSNKNEVVKLSKSYNTQILLIESGKKNLVVLFQGDVKDTKLYDITNSTEITNNNTKFKYLKEHNLSELDRITKEGTKRENNEVVLNLNDPMLNPHIELLVISTNVTIYMPLGDNTRISTLIWGRKQLDFDPEANPIITVITNGSKKYLLVDEYVATHSTINRALYTMEQLDSAYRLRLVGKASCQVNEGKIDITRNCLSSTWYEMISKTLPIRADFNDVRVGKVKYDYHNLTMLFMPHGHDFSIGIARVRDKEMETNPGHRWRQLHRQGHDEVYSVYTMSGKGIEEHVLNGEGATTSSGTTPFVRVAIPKLDAGAVALMLDDLDYNGIKTTISKTENAKVTVISAEEANSFFNPLVFGHHEMQFLSNSRCVQVKITEQQDGLREISAVVKDQEGVNSTVVFREQSAGSGYFDADKDSLRAVRFVDINGPINNLTKYCNHLDVMDFNKGIFPHYVRYLTLNRTTMYFTGDVLSTGLRLVFGELDLKIPATNYAFHLWVLYQTDDSSTATAYLHYGTDQGMQTTFYTVESSKDARDLKRPISYNCNWGPMSNLEFYIVNHTLIRHVQTKHELSPIDLDISSESVDPAILRLQFDHNTTLYTTLASSGSVIDDVFHKGATIRGVPKQVVKHVYHSNGTSDDVILVVVRTVSSVLAQAYRFSANDAFEPVAASAIDPKEHSGIYSILSRMD
ncbi:putative histidine-tRNA ligase [Babesia sp. Xinjiang]|uniref:putative histidine-tRNA ligase n=1 Tax=Babesia sp. Xinjiang TaxID=462227 RepID=UPI000A21510A|nr:putative histidine-tRNA ligase [Babesia sp. Xinjiang]ORM40324.1 putative histidine-tRNA ligase [Babesia sp. Xinjiang]